MKSRLLQQTLSLILAIALAIAYASSMSRMSKRPDVTYTNQTTTDTGALPGERDDRI